MLFGVLKHDKENSMARERQIILDTETTGFYADQGDRMLEFAGIEMKNRQLTHQALHLYIHPERDVPAEAAAVHGLTLDILESKNAPKFAEVGQQIADFLRGAELIIHNAKFDVGFLNMEFQRMGLPTLQELDCEITDTLAMARKEFPGQKASLDALCTRFEIDRSKRIFHGALIDCELLAEVYLAMSGGQVDMGLMDAAPSDATGKGRPLPAVRPQGRLRVISASPEEKAAHAAYLAGMGNALWEKV